MTTSINFLTRQAARNTNLNFKSSGKVSTLVDNGISSPVGERWTVLVEMNTPLTSKKTKKIVKSRSNINVGFDIRKVTTGVQGFDLFYQGEYILRRDTKLEVYEAGVIAANKMNVNYTTLNYK